MISTVLAIIAALIAVGVLLGLVSAAWLAVAVLLVALAVLAPAIPFRGNA